MLRLVSGTRGAFKGGGGGERKKEKKLTGRNKCGNKWRETSRNVGIVKRSFFSEESRWPPTGRVKRNE